MADSYLRRVAGTFGSFAQTLIPGLGYVRDKPLEATEKQLTRGDVIVDPSRVMAGAGQLPYNPSILVTRKGLGVFDSMKRDEQVKACLAFKKSAILASGWEVVSPGDQEEDWEVTQFVRDTFTNFPGGWNAALEKILLAHDYGYSITEKVYGEVPWAAPKLALTRLAAVKLHYIDFEANPNGVLTALIQCYVPGNEQSLYLPPDKFVVYSHDAEFENHYGRSDLEAAYRAWWVKDNAYKWFAVYLERYGMSPVFALYNQNVYQGGQMEELKKIVKNIQNATLGLIPRNAADDIELWTQQVSAQSKEIFLAALNRFDADIGRALLTPSLIGATPDSGGAGGEQAQGSFARSKTHFDLFLIAVGRSKERLQSDAVNSQIIPQLCDLNFPGLKSYPLFRLMPLEAEDKQWIYTLWKELVAGKVVNQIEDDETHLRKALGFPENDDPQIPEPAPVPGQLKPGENEVQGPKEVPDEEQTEEMQQYSEENDAVWVEMPTGEVVAMSEDTWGTR